MHQSKVIFLALITVALAAFAQDVITNESVVKMVKAGLSEQVIVEAVKRHPAKFTVSPDALISLKSAGVPDAVISAMLGKEEQGGASGGRESPAPVTTSRERGACKTIEVVQFEVAPGIDFPGDYLSALMGDIITQLSQTHKFSAVLSQGQKLPDGTPPCVRLTGTVTKYKKAAGPFDIS